MEVFIYWKRIPAEEQLKMKREGESAGRRILREILTSRHHIGGDRIVFADTPEGKPFLPRVPEAVFSISDTRNLAAVAVGFREAADRECSLGFDMEYNRQVSLSLIRRFFHPEECSWILEAKPDAARNRRALEIWTGKEAFGKWSGEGIRFRTQELNTRRADIRNHMTIGQTEELIWSLYTDRPANVRWIAWTDESHTGYDKEETDGFI